MDHASMNTDELRKAVRTRAKVDGIKSTYLTTGAANEEIVDYLNGGTLPGQLYHKVDGDSLTIYGTQGKVTADLGTWRATLSELGPIIGVETAGTKTATTRTGSGNRRGRPAPAIPEDRGPLVKAIQQAHQGGRPFTRTGANGLHSRRSELPETFSGIGRDRIELMVADMIEAGLLAQLGKVLSVPYS